MHRVALVSITATALWAGCGSEDRPRADDDAAVLDVMEAGRSALLAGDAEAACALLTSHARDRAPAFLSSGETDVPHTCEEVLRALWEEEHRPDATPTWSRDLAAARFTVTALGQGKARVRLTVPVEYGPVIRFSLRKEGSEWRIDDSDAVPSGD